MHFAPEHFREPVEHLNQRFGSVEKGEKHKRKGGRNLHQNWHYGIQGRMVVIHNCDAQFEIREQMADQTQKVAHFLIKISENRAKYFIMIAILLLLNGIRHF